MARNTSVALSDHFNDFIADQIARGHFGSASEVMRAGLRLLEQHETQMARLREELVKGEASGDLVPYEGRKWLAEWRLEWEAEQGVDGHSPAAQRA